MSCYLLEPLDTQFYRSTLPFDAGMDTYSTTNPLPWPRTVYGAVRALGFSEKEDVSLAIESKVEKDIVWGDWEQPGDAYIRGPFIIRKEKGSAQFLLPVPLDLSKEKNGNIIYHGVPILGDGDLSSFSDCTWLPGVNPLHFPHCPEGTILESLEGEYFLSTGDWPNMERLKNYLIQKLNTREITKFEEMDQTLTAEHRIGIKRSQNIHTAEEGMLYAAVHHRFLSQPKRKEFTYWVEIKRADGSDPVLPDRGVLQLGGESRPVEYKKLTSEEPFGTDWTLTYREEVVRIIKEQGRFKLYLLTPGIFGSDALPFEINGGGIFYSCCSQIARLVGVAGKKSKPLGGWNIQKKRPKSLEIGIMEGTVYFFEIQKWKEEPEKEKKAGDWFDAMNFKSLCSGVPAKEGFGITLVGGWYV